MERRASRTVWVLLALVLVAAWATKARCLLTDPGWDGGEQYSGYCYTDIYPLWWAERLNEGATPYLDHPVEYPVLTGLWMSIANAAAGVLAPAQQGLAFLHVTMLMGAAMLAGTVALLRRMAVPPRRLLWLLLAPSLVAYAFVNWDALPVLLATAAIALHRRGDDVLAGTFAGLGAAAKLYPALLLPLFVLARWRQGRARDAVLTAVAGAGSWLLVNLPVALAAPQGWSRFFQLSRTRPADHDSLYRIVEVELRSGPFDVATLNLVTAGLFVVAGAAVLLAGTRRRDPRDWWQLSLPLLIVFLLTSKVYSPQFSLWLLPLMVMVVPRPAPYVAFLVTDIAVFLTRFPWLGGRQGFTPAVPYGVFATTIALRAVVLLWIVWLTVRQPPDDLPPVPDAPAPAPAAAARPGAS